MKFEFIEKLDTQRFNELISSASERLYISLPNIHEELADVLLKAKTEIKDIRITLDNSEDNFRNGYGNIDAVYKLKEGGICVFDSPKNRVSFIVFDDEAYFIFPESRIFAYDDIGDNAVKIDPITKLHLIECFFPTETLKISKDAETETDMNGVVDRRKKITEIVKKEADKYAQFVKDTIDNIAKPKDKINVVPLDSKNLDVVKKKLKVNPPKHPDLQRQIQTYTAKIQFVELHFEGSNMHVTRVTIPPQAMPFKDEEIKKVLETKMRLFNNLTSNEKFKDFFNIKDKVDKIRKDYCNPIKSRKKNIISISKKEIFKEKICDLKKEISELNKMIPQYLDEEILKSKSRIRGELKKFLEENPPEEIKGYNQEILKVKVDDIVYGIVSKIKYPKPQKIIKNIDLKINFYDLTFEDFKDDDFLRELKDHEIMKEGEIKDIVSMREAFEAKE